MVNSGKLSAGLDLVALGLLALLFWVGMNYVSLNLGGSGVQLPYNATVWIIATCVMFLAVVKVCVSGRFVLRKDAVLYLACIALMLLPLTYTDRLFLKLEVLRLSGLLAGWIFFIALAQFSTPRFKLLCLYILLVSSVIQTLWGLLQYYFIFTPGPLFLGASLGRPFGVFQQVNVFSIYLSIGVMIGLYLWQTRFRKNLVAGIGVALLALLNAHLAVLSEADTAKFAGLVSVVVYAALWWRNGRASKSSKRMLVLVILMAGIGTLAPKVWFDIRPAAAPVELSQGVDAVEIQEKKTSVSAVDELLLVADSTKVKEHRAHFNTESLRNSLGTRTTIYPVIISMILDRPITGYGIGTFSKQYSLAQGEYLLDNPDAPYEQKLGHAHNEVLYWWVELGLLAALGVFGFLLVWLYLVRQRHFSLRRAGMCLPLVLQSMVELPMYHAAAHYIVFILVLYVAYRGRARSFALHRLRWVALPLSSFAAYKVISFLVTTIIATGFLIQFQRSDRQAIAYLQKIENPAAFSERFEFEIMTWKLRREIASGEISKTFLMQYVYWAYSYLQYAPQQVVYSNMIDALTIRGSNSGALQFAREGVLIFPHNKDLRSRLERLERWDASREQARHE